MEAAEPSTARAVLQLDPSALVDDLYNSALVHCADSFDELDRVVREELSATLRQDETAAVLQGTSTIYRALQGELDAQLQRFEQCALETCLHVPAGLMAQQASDVAGQLQRAMFTPQAPAADEPEAGELSEGAEAAADAELAALRSDIGAAKAAGRGLLREIAALDKALAESGDVAVLAEVAGALSGKENAAAEDAHALLTSGTLLEAGVAELAGLRAKRGERLGAASRDAPALEKDILRRQAAIKAAPAEDLRRIVERLA